MAVYAGANGAFLDWNSLKLSLEFKRGNDTVGLLESNDLVIMEFIFFGKLFFQVHFGIF